VLRFTGESIYGVNPATGKINRHVDTWDSIRGSQVRQKSLRQSLAIGIHVWRKDS
jgi:hypothetical protein